MPLHAQTILDDLETTDVSNACVSPSSGVRADAAVAADEPVDFAATVFIELNFNAFADNVPPSKHAKRSARYDDPSIQDFADQALELAALRAELKRLNHDHDNLQHALRLRDMWLKALRDELASVQTQLRSTTLQLSAAQSLPAPVAPVAPNATPEAPRWQLLPVDHDGEAILLSRDIITIGRTRESDICIPSRGVSRDHARLLTGPGSVTIVDMDSANGCFVNDEPVKRQKLRSGDVVRIGDRSYRVADSLRPPP